MSCLSDVHHRRHIDSRWDPLLYDIHKTTQRADLVHCILTGLCLAGVRARQEKVPFATCEDEETLQEEVRSLLGKRLLSFTPCFATDIRHP